MSTHWQWATASPAGKPGRTLPPAPPPGPARARWAAPEACRASAGPRVWPQTSSAARPVCGGFRCGGFGGGGGTRQRQCECNSHSASMQCRQAKHSALPAAVRAGCRQHTQAYASTQTGVQSCSQSTDRGPAHTAAARILVCLLVQSSTVPCPSHTYTHTFAVGHCVE